MRLLIRATNWVGDAVMSLPAIRAAAARYPGAQVTVLALPWVAELYEREGAVDEVIPYEAPRGARGWVKKWGMARRLAERRFDVALILANSFDSALAPWLAGIPRRIGYGRDGRSLLLTEAITPPRRGEIPRHESYYYLELLRRAGWLGELPGEVTIRLEGAAAAAAEGRALFAGRGMSGRVMGISPGAAYGTAKRYPAGRFAAAAAEVLLRVGGGSVAVFGAAGEKAVCGEVVAALGERGVAAVNLAGATTLREFIQLAAACFLFLTNDSGSMHIASALGVPTVAVFGATDHVGTGPTGELARVVRRDVACSPCLLRECPIDHRCMTGVTPEMVAEAALTLVK